MVPTRALANLLGLPRLRSTEGDAFSAVSPVPQGGWRTGVVLTEPGLAQTVESVTLSAQTVEQPNEPVAAATRPTAGRASRA